MGSIIGTGVTLRGGLGIFSYAIAAPSNLVLWLDATNSASYSGSGTIWYDRSGNGNNFNILASAYNAAGAVKYMDFNGSYGCAKNGSDISISSASGVTFCVWTRVSADTSNWRTLTRSYVNDHHVIIEYAGYQIGMYDNDGAGFLGSGFYQYQLPNWGTSNWVVIFWRWQNFDPYYQISYNDTPGTIRGSIASGSANFDRGFGSIGAYHEGNTDPSSASQYWGDISVFMMYNKYLTDSECLSNYNYYKSYFGN